MLWPSTLPAVAQRVDMMSSHGVNLRQNLIPSCSFCSQVLLWTKSPFSSGTAFWFEGRAAWSYVRSLKRSEEVGRLRNLHTMTCSVVWLVEAKMKRHFFMGWSCFCD